MNALTTLSAILVCALFVGAGAMLGVLGHSIVIGRKMSMLIGWEADLEGRELTLATTPPAIGRARAVGTSIVKPRDPNPNAPTRAREDEAPGPTRRQRAYRFAADAYPTITSAARALSDPLPVVSVPGRPQDTRALADALTGNPRAHVGRHAATADDWT